MSLSLSELKTKMQPYILRNIQDQTSEWIFDSEFEDIANFVADQLNEYAYINVERYYRKTTSGENAYDMAGDIIKMRRFKYEAADFNTQWYAIVHNVYAAGEDHEGEYYSTIVLKNDPTTSDVQMDINYLRRCFKMADDADELDLPDKFIMDYLELLKTKIKIDFGDADPLLFDRDLRIFGDKCVQKNQRPQLHEGRVKRYFGGLDTTSDFIYDITEKQLSSDHVSTDLSGNYYWYE